MNKLANITSICSRAVELGCVQYHHASLGPDPKEACSGPQNTKPHSQYETPQESGSSQIPYNNPPLLKVAGLTKIG